MLAIAAFLAAAGCAQAARHAATAHRHAPHRPHTAARHRHATAHRRRAGRRPLVGVGDVPGCLAGSPSGLGVLQRYHASILRVVIDPTHGADGAAIGCLRAAVAAGYRVHLSLDYSNRWSIGQDVAYFKQQLAYYGPYAWAISIGNEQDLAQGGVFASASRYAAVWRAVEPLVAHRAPHAIRVAGEVSPWGFSWLRRAYAARLPGAQALSVHAYTTHRGFDIAQVAAWARRIGLPLWVTEGLDGPGAWTGSHHREHAVPLSRLTGATVAEAWLG